MRTKETTDFEINFLGKPSKGKPMRSTLELLNTPGFDLTSELSTFLDGEAVKTILGKIALSCRDDGAKFTDTRRLDAIAECVGEKYSMWTWWRRGTPSFSRGLCGDPTTICECLES